ncbi:MAG: hypothetical protein LBH32_11980 [Dysgonamonadaceae bacterium]|jgi:hypothetical protein|nr:hypothetical protein [Dysgonamonadaceae bacterium]
MKNFRTKSKKWAAYSVAALMSVAVCSCKDKDNDDEQEQSTEYFYHGDHSYQIVKTAKTWSDAVADAVAKGGYLTEIESQEEQDAIWQAVQKSGISPTYRTATDGGGIGYLWIGATDRSVEGIWLWNEAGKTIWMGDGNGSAPEGSYYNWGGKASGHTNEPDNYTDQQSSPKGQNAAAIGLAAWPNGASLPLGTAGEWNDIAESNQMYYVVEFNEKK